MQTASSWIWTWAANSISYNNICVKHTSIHYGMDVSFSNETTTIAKNQHNFYSLKLYIDITKKIETVQSKQYLDVNSIYCREV